MISAPIVCIYILLLLLQNLRILLINLIKTSNLIFLYKDWGVYSYPLCVASLKVHLKGGHVPHFQLYKIVGVSLALQVLQVHRRLPSLTKIKILYSMKKSSNLICMIYYVRRSVGNELYLKTIHLPSCYINHLIRQSIPSVVINIALFLLFIDYYYLK